MLTQKLFEKEKSILEIELHFISQGQLSYKNHLRAQRASSIKCSSISNPQKE
jgi:hypothetical protein